MIYTNLSAVEAKQHGMFESSRLKATDIGRIYDALVRDDTGREIAVDNGVAIKIGEFTGNGLQEVYATIAKKADKIAVTGAPALVKDAFTTLQAQPFNYTNIAGNPVKSYEVTKDDIFAIADYQFTDATAAEVKVGAYVNVDENGAWEASATEPAGCAFVGKIHSIAAGNFYTMVRIVCVKNEE